MRVSLTTLDFESKMNNIVQYSLGFIEGVHAGKRKFLNNLGLDTIDLLKNYIDSNARMNPKALHHVYEWNKTGSPEARLFDIDYTISNLGLSFKSSFRQSKSLANGASEPFYNKAEIMENGVPVTIKPRKNVLVFDINGETIFTRKEIVNQTPGGSEVIGSYEKIFDEFFSKYFTQAFLYSSGLLLYLSNPSVYKKNISSGARRGKIVGKKVGYAWIANAKAGVE